MQTLPRPPNDQDKPAAEPLAFSALLFLLLAHAIALSLLGFMLLHKHRSMLVELAVARAEISTSAAQSAMAGATLSGLEASEMQQIQQQLACLPGPETGIAAVSMFSLKRAQGATNLSSRVEFSSTTGRAGQTLAAGVLPSQPPASNRWTRNDLNAPALGLLVQGIAGDAVAGLWVELDPAPLLAQAEQVQREMLTKLLLLGSMAGLVLIIAFVAARRKIGQSTSVTWLTAMALLPTLIASSVLAWQAREQLSSNLQPAINAKSVAVASALAERIEHALKLGIPPAKLQGSEAYFAEVLAHHPDLARIKLTLAGISREEQRPDRQPAFENTRKAPIHDDNNVIGEISVIPDQEFVDRSLGAIAADIAVVLLVTILSFRELLASLIARQRTTTEDAQGAAEVQSLRLPLFLFILSEELTRAFMPLFFHDFAGSSGLALNTAISLPISIYMVFFALTTPYAGGWADRYGAHRVFALGALFAAGGFVWMALAGQYWEVLCARAFCASGYALGTMACQRQIIASTTGENRVRGLALFVGAVSVAAICGAAIGGVLAERLGYRLVLLFSAGVAIAGYLIFISSQRQEFAKNLTDTNFRFANLLPLLKNRRFMRLMLGAAIPAKISLAGFLFYLTPLSLQDANYSPAAIGRAIMLYYILLTASNPLASYFSERSQRHLVLILGGMLLIGLGGMAGLTAPLLPADIAVWLGIIALGLGTGLSAAPMQALALELAPTGNPTSVLVALRTLERLGSVIGPLLAGLLLGGLPGGGVMAAIGSLSLLGAILLLGLWQRTPLPASGGPEQGPA